ncbi:MAG: DUF262 domain-containing protein [Candidatus Bathyarchaeota archaeon]
MDSILRSFDIASVYLYEDKITHTFDCIDGRQRINAISSFLGENRSPEEEEKSFHNYFRFKTFNEVFEDTSLSKLDGLTYEDIKEKYPKYEKKIKEFLLTAVIFSSDNREEEINLLNLQFLRLQLGSVLNAGEKLHAMTGDIRDRVFEIGKKHEFFKKLSIPHRRYAREQVCAQILFNVFQKKKKNDFSRCRYEDLQQFFKNYSALPAEDKSIVDQAKQNLDLIVTKFGDNLSYIKNRALAVSLYFFICELLARKEEVVSFISFFDEFLRTLKWQIGLGVKMDPAYYDLLSFQTYISQAAVEGYAIRIRHQMLLDYFGYYKKRRVLFVGISNIQK